uniref:Protein FAM199X n=1 Tax=Amblyomma sculptum TaxID=1581419 RepID=A0A1E1XTA8_AMBSC
MIESSALSTSPWNVDIWKDDSTPFMGFEDLLDPGECSLLLRGDLVDNDEWSPPERPPSIASPGPLDVDICWSDLEDFMKKDTSANFGLDLDELSLDPTESSEVLSDWSSQSGGAATWEDFEGHRSRQRLRRGLSPAPSDVVQASSTKGWASMSGDEQLRTVEALTEAISHHLGLREQLDVIRIIDPMASIDLSSDREFPVDLRRLDDRKLREIAEYVRKNTAATQTAQVGNDTKAAGSTSSRRKSRRGGSHHSEHSSSASSMPSAARKGPRGHWGKANRERCPDQRGRRKRHRQQQESAVQWQQEKALRQKLKEKRSGLFRHEEVLTITRTAPAAAAAAASPSSLLAADEDYVDILG